MGPINARSLRVWATAGADEETYQRTKESIRQPDRPTDTLHEKLAAELLFFFARKLTRPRRTNGKDACPCFPLLRMYVPCVCVCERQALAESFASGPDRGAGAFAPDSKQGCKCHWKLRISSYCEKLHVSEGMEGVVLLWLGLQLRVREKAIQSS